jgi:hypothetical protein
MSPPFGRTSARRLWLAIALGPLAWLAYVQIAYALVPWACRHPGAAGRLGLYGAGAAVLAIAVVAVVLAWPAWRATDRATADDAPPAGRTRFMALTGIGSAALFVVVAIAGVLPLFLLAPCE